MCTDSDDKLFVVLNVREVVIGASWNFHTLFGNKIPPAQNLLLSDLDVISLSYCQKTDALIEVLSFYGAVWLFK